MAAAAKLSPRDARRARELAEWVETGQPKDGMEWEWARGEARHLLLALKPRRKLLALPAPQGRRGTRGATRE